MAVKEVAFIAYPVTDLARAQAFYEGKLDLKPTKTWVKDNSSGFIEYDIGATTLAIGAGAPSFKPGKTGATVALEVDNIDALTKDLKKKGVQILLETTDTPVCQMAIVEDPDGNQIMLHQRKLIDYAKKQKNN